MRRPVLSETALYFGDNGRCFCGACAGASAKYTGYDISGQPVHKVTPEDVRAWDAEMIRYGAAGIPLGCEDCGRAASLLHTPERTR